jgi:deazaflavin-dependent oxidoreductase (nitroreductase family)
MDSINPQVVKAPPSRSQAIALSRRFLGPIWLRVGFTAVLTVPGRRSGTPRHVSLLPIEVDGTRYLLSQYGASDWVRNLRAAAGRGELRRKGHAESFTAVEAPGAERDAVIAAFHAKTPKQFTSDFDQRPDAADHPTFRVEPIS